MGISKNHLPEEKKQKLAPGKCETDTKTDTKTCIFYIHLYRAI